MVDYVSLNTRGDAHNYYVALFLFLGLSFAALLVDCIHNLSLSPFPQHTHTQHSYTLSYLYTFLGGSTNRIVVYNRSHWNHSQIFCRFTLSTLHSSLSLSLSLSPCWWLFNRSLCFSKGECQGAVGQFLYNDVQCEIQRGAGIGATFLCGIAFITSVFNVLCLSSPPFSGKCISFISLLAGLCGVVAVGAFLYEQNGGALSGLVGAEMHLPIIMNLIKSHHCMSYIYIGCSADTHLYTCKPGWSLYTFAIGAVLALVPCYALKIPATAWSTITPIPKIREWSLSS